MTRSTPFAAWTSDLHHGARPTRRRVLLLEGFDFPFHELIVWRRSIQTMAKKSAIEKNKQRAQAGEANSPASARA